MIKKLIERYLASTPNKKLVTDIEKTYTQIEFKKKVFFFKNKLKSLSKDNNGVGILLDRNADYLAAIFACILAQKYYVPLSLRSSKQFINEQIKDSKISYLIKYDRKKEIKIKLIKNKSKNKDINDKKIAYIIFTSGSTGPKKGACISYKAFNSYINSIKKKFKKKFNSRSLLINGEFTFDIVNADLAFALLYKTEICITPDSLNLFSFFLILEKRKVESIYAVPTAWKNIIKTGNLMNKKKFNFIKQINSGGELFTRSLYKKIKKFAPKSKVYNFYGPTEFTINSHCSEILENKKLFLNGNATVGKNLPNVNSKFLFNQNINNNFGELLLSGNQMMDGYVNSDEKPFLQIKNKIYYKTGDNFIKKKGNYFFKGRLKDYIKVSGYRVNIQELENKLYDKLNFEGYFKLVNDRLNLFLNKKNDTKKLSIFFDNNFEWYEKPKKIIYMKEFPTLSNGKIARNKLK
tara:strand:- start:767 stop:2155 length:1389 start_codon:yes stop_codon:yes gene_type:complete